jgi:hypothetical protein
MRAALLAALLLAGAAAAEPRAIEARLAGHAILPAETFVAPPADAPPGFAVSGRFAGPGGRRIEAPGSVEGRTWIGPPAARRTTGVTLPFEGQPVQGISGVARAGDGTYWAVSDNGFGTKANSPDALLMAHRMRPDWRTGEVEILETVVLSDPDRVIPFPIATGHTVGRYLTGADLDPESVRLAGGLLWFGDEFGPWLIATDMRGRVRHVAGARLGGRALRSPDHPAIRTPSLPGAVRFEVARSRGFEGLARAPEGGRLYALLEGPLRDPATGAPETDAEGRSILRLLEFDLAARDWTGRSWTYPLEAPGHAIGEITMISEHRGLVIERDGGEGAPELACPEGEAGTDCFPRPARFKRVYLVELGDPGPVRKLAHLDLMDIADPAGRARIGGRDGRFAMPMVTIESVEAVGGGRILVVNDNNLPFSAGRRLDAADATEWILIDVGELP